MGLAF